MKNVNNPLRVFLVLTFTLVFGTLMALLPGLPGLPFLLFPLRGGEELRYPNGITFEEGSNGFATVHWDGGDWDRPGPCPLTVHVAGVDYDPARLGSLDQLRRDGWSEQIFENPKGTQTGRTMLHPGHVFRCSYRHGLLTRVTVYSDEAPAAVAVGFDKGPVDLPTTRDAIIQAFGPPLPGR